MNKLALIHQFRNAILSLVEYRSYLLVDFEEWCILNSFPFGNCSLASDLLGVYLIEHGYTVTLITASVKSDEHPGVNSHAWLEIDGEYVDITSSQFPDLTRSRITIQQKCASEWLHSYALLAKKDNNYSERQPELKTDFINNTKLYELIKLEMNRI